MARSWVIAWPLAQTAANASSLKAARMVARLGLYSTRSAGHQVEPDALSRASAAPSSRAAPCGRPWFAAKPVRLATPTRIFWPAVRPSRWKAGWRTRKKRSRSTAPPARLAAPKG